MAKLTYEGLDEYINKLGVLATDAKDINRGALGEGAGFMADAIQGALEGLPTHPEGRPKKGATFTGPTDNEKGQIIANFGIARFREGQKLETSIGFHGYVNTHSHRFNDNVPTGMLMQAIEYGSAERSGTHTVNNTINSNKDAVASVIEKYMDEKIQKIMN